MLSVGLERDRYTPTLAEPDRPPGTDRLWDVRVFLGLHVLGTETTKRRQVSPGPRSKPSPSRWAGPPFFHRTQRRGGDHPGGADVAIFGAGTGPIAHVRVAGLTSPGYGVRCERDREDGHVGHEEVRFAAVVLRCACAATCGRYALPHSAKRRQREGASERKVHAKESAPHLKRLRWITGEKSLRNQRPSRQGLGRDGRFGVGH